VNGTDFHFVDAGDFIAMRDRNEFAEWAQVHGHYYGTPAAPWRARSPAGWISCSTSTPAAPAASRPLPGGGVGIHHGSLPGRAGRAPARAEERRGGEIARRMSRAREEIAAWREYDYLIINRDVKEAVDQLATIIQAERCRTSRLTIRFPDVEVPD
jgi:guanylate kinase